MSIVGETFVGDARCIPLQIGGWRVESPGGITVQLLAGDPYLAAERHAHDLATRAAAPAVTRLSETVEEALARARDAGLTIGPLDYAAAAAAIEPAEVCGHGVPIYGHDCDACDAGNAESDLYREYDDSWSRANGQ